MADEPERSHEDEERCSSSSREGLRCELRRGHASLHSSTVDGAGYAWSDRFGNGSNQSAKHRKKP
jgi:hypothetical protein